MADTIKLTEHIKAIEDRLKGSISTVLKDLEVPIDFYLNNISIDFMPIQELGRDTKKLCIKRS